MRCCFRKAPPPPEDTSACSGPRWATIIEDFAGGLHVGSSAGSPSNGRSSPVSPDISQERASFEMDRASIGRASFEMDRASIGRSSRDATPASRMSLSRLSFQMDGSSIGRSSRETTPCSRTSRRVGLQTDGPQGSPSKGWSRRSRSTPASSQGASLPSRALEERPRSLEEATGRTVRAIDNEAKLDPFIAVDDFSVKYPAAFIDHPHRGFESATYVLPEQENADSVLLYYDSTQGQQEFSLGAGGLVRMITGRGISHCEVVKEKRHQMRAINIWFNYPDEHRLCKAYSNFYNMGTEQMPVVRRDGIRAIILQGELDGVRGSCFKDCPSPIEWIHFTLQPGTNIVQDLPDGFNGVVYCVNGKGQINGSDISGAYVDDEHPESSVQVGGGSFNIQAKAGSVFDVVYLSARPVGDPTLVCDISADGCCGTFVMSTEGEIKQALRAWLTATDGFEYKYEWGSPWSRTRRSKMSREAEPAQDRTVSLKSVFRGNTIEYLKSEILAEQNEVTVAV